MNILRQQKWNRSSRYEPPKIIAFTIPICYFFVSCFCLFCWPVCFLQPCDHPLGIGLTYWLSCVWCFIFVFVAFPFGDILVRNVWFITTILPLAIRNGYQILNNMTYTRCEKYGTTMLYKKGRDSLFNSYFNHLFITSTIIGPRFYSKTRILLQYFSFFASRVVNFAYFIFIWMEHPDTHPFKLSTKCFREMITFVWIMPWNNLPTNYLW